MVRITKRRFRKFLRNVPNFFVSKFSKKFEIDFETSEATGAYLLLAESKKRKQGIRGKINNKTRNLKQTIFSLRNNTNFQAFSFHRFFIHKLKHFRIQSLRPILAGVLIFVMIVQIFQPGPNDVIYGKTQTFVQTDWGTADTSTATPGVNYPQEPANLTGWTKYFSKSATIVVSSASLKLTSSAGSWADTSAADFNLYTSKSNTFVSTTGNYVSLLKPLDATCTAHGECASGICEYGVCATPPCNYETSVSYSGQTYDLVEIGTQCWTKQNMNVGTKLAAASTMPSSNSTIEKWCYSNNDTNNGLGGCNTGSASGDGGLYTWSEALQLDPACNTTACNFPGNRQGICPSGYHVPSDDEFKTLEMFLGMSVAQAGTASAYRGTDQGTKLKLGGTSGFDGVLSGYNSGSFISRNSDVYYWTATGTAGTTYGRSLNSAQAGVGRYNISRSWGSYIRCIKDRGLATGATCSSNTQCASGLCSSLVCKIPTGNSCTNNTECSSGLCENNVCRVDNGGACSQTTDCRISGNSTCSSNVCKAPIGAACTTASSADTKCISNWCGASNTCALKPNGTACSAATECSSNECTENICMQACGASTPCGDSCSYSGNSYPTVLMGTQCWTKRNLNVGTMLASAATMPTLNNGAIEKWCNNNSAANCTTYGGLYTWTEAHQISGCTSETGSCSVPANNQGICPSGWHIPSNAEFTSLTGSYSYAQLVGGGSLLELLLVGARHNPYFLDPGTDSYYQSQEQGNVSTGYAFVVTGSTVSLNTWDKIVGRPVRCIKNKVAGGEACVGNYDCLSGECGSGVCKSLTLESCSTDVDCVTNNVCSSGICKRNNGQTCSTDTQCNKGRCNTGVCSDAWLSGCSGIEVYYADGTGKSWGPGSTDCVSPQCVSNIYLSSDNTVDFTGYPARDYCKSLGGRLPSRSEATCINTNRVLFNTVSQAGYYYWINEESSLTQAYTIGTNGAHDGLFIGANKTASASFPTRCVRFANIATISKSASTISFSSTPNVAPADQTFTLSNTGSVTLNYTITDNQTYCSASPSSGTVAAGGNTTITVSMSAQSSNGSYPCTITITDPAASNNPQTIDVSYTVATAAPTIGRSPTTLTYTSAANATPANQTFTLSNAGNATLNYTITDNQTYCSASPSSGTVAAGGNTTITVSMSAQTSAGSYPCTVTITDAAAANSPQTITITHTVSAGSVCGNGVVEDTEQCDGADLGSSLGQCSNVGSYSGGTLACAAGCVYDTTNCTAGSGSCPYLYSWNGDKFEFLTDLYGSGGLAYKRGSNTLVPMPHRIYQIDNFEPKDGKIEFRIREDLDEIDYFDRLQLLTYVVPETETFGLNIPPFEPAGVGKPLKIHTIGRDLIKPISAKRLDTGEDVKDLISDVDDKRMIFNPDPNYFVTTTFEVDFGDISNYPQKKLVITGETVFPKSPEGIARRTLYPKAQYLEVQDSSGKWQIVPDTKVLFSKPISFEGRQALDISNVFISSSTKLRITYAYKTYINQFAFDGSEDLVLPEPELIPMESAEMWDSGVWHNYDEDGHIPDYYVSTDNSSYSRYAGNYTKFGDVKPLLETQDDKFVIMSRGDEITVKFRVPESAVPTGYRRLYIMDTWGYYKSVVSQTELKVDNFPFAAMSNFPYATNTYPYTSDADYQNYLNTWNTRVCDGVNNQCVSESEQAASNVLNNIVDAVINTYESIVNGIQTLLGATKDILLAELPNLFTVYPVYALPNSGTYTSQVKDLTTKVEFNTLTWGETLQAGTTITMEVRAGNIASPDGTWTAWTSVTNGGSLSSLTGNRYVQYRATLNSTVSDNNVPNLNDVTINYTTYSSTGELISSPYDTGDSGTIMGDVSWHEDATLPTGSQVVVEIRTAPSVDMSGATAWSSASGCTKVGTLVTCSRDNYSSEVKNPGNHHYFQYRITLNSDGSATPTFDDISVKYVINAPPVVQNVTASQNSDGSVTINYEIKDEDTNDGQPANIGFVVPSFEYCTNGGASCYAIAAFPAGATDPKSINTSDPTQFTSYSTTWTPSTDKPNVFDNTAFIKVTVDDREGANRYANASSPVFTLDTKPPVTTNSSLVVDASVVPQAAITLNATDDNTVEMEINTSGTFTGAWEAYSTSKNLNLSGATNIYGRFRDSKNNISPTIHVTLPDVPQGIMVQDTSNFKVTPHDFRLFLAWQKVAAPAAGFGSYRISRALSTDNGATFSAPQVIYSETTLTRNSYPDDSAAENAYYSYTVVAVDAYGNTSYSPVGITAMADGKQNLGEGGGGTGMPPNVASVQSSLIKSNSALITWDTDSLSDSTVNYATDAGSLGTVASRTVNVPTLAKNEGSTEGRHEVFLSNLKPNTTYSFKVSSVDTLQTQSTNNTIYTFTTTPGPEITAAPNSDPKNTSATITWDTDIAASSKVYYSTTPDLSATLNQDDTSLVTNHSVTISNLATSTKYYYYVESTGGGGTAEDKNVLNGTPTYYTFSTRNETDAPTFSNFKATPATSTATITWKTNKDSDSQIDYGATNSYGSQNTLDNTLTVVHSMELTGLTPGTLYHYRARSSDSNGNLGLSADQTFTTLTEQDTNPPVISNIATSSVSLNSATITWTTDKGTNETVSYGTDTSYGDLAGDSTRFTSTTHSVVLRNLQGNTTYHFKVNATDSLGNSASSNDLTFITTADITPPVINNLTKLVNQTAAFIKWDTNEPSDSKVEFGLTNSYGEVASTTDFTNSHSVLLSNLSPNTTYYYKVISKDSSGNESFIDNSGAGYTFTTDATPDTNPPTFTSGPSVNSIALHSATISWQTDKNTNGTVEFGTTNAYGSIMGNLYDFTTNTHSITLTDLLGNTTYYFKAHSMDAVANAASSTGSFTTQADLTMPVITASSTLIADTAAQINWVTDEIANSEVNYSLNLNQVTSPCNVASGCFTVTSTEFYVREHSLPLTGLTQSTTYYYQIKTTDPSGNTLTTPVFNFLTQVFGSQTIIIDNTKPNVTIDNTNYADQTIPNISNLSVRNVDPFSVEISWTTDRDSNTLVKYGKSANYGSLAGDELSLTSQHSLVLVNLIPGSTYHFKATSFVNAKYPGSSADTTFTTLNIDGTEAKPNEPSTTPEEDKQESERQFVIDKILKAPLSLLASMLDAFSKNPMLSKLPEENIAKTFAEIAAQIGTAPNIVGLRPQVEVKGNVATVRWSTDKKTSGVVSFAKESEYAAGSDKPYTTSIVDSDSLSTIHTVELTSLESATRYHFQVASKGEIGPEAKSKDYTFETEAVLPEVSDAKVTDVKATSAIVTWKTNVPTASTLDYTKLEDKKTLSAGDPALLVTHVFTLNNLEPGKKYSLVIRAKNESGQEQPSSPLTFETVIDKDGPEISSVSANSTLYPGANAKVQTIISWDTDEPTVSQLFYQEGVQDSDNVKSTPIENSPSEKHFVVLTAFKPGSVYKYWIESTDLSGNKSTSDKFTTLTPTEKQTIIDIISNNFQSVFGWTKNVGF